MEIDDALKLVGAVISVVTVGKLIYDLAISRKMRHRDDYKFAKDFFEELKKIPPPHPFVIERGYHALAGDTSLSVREVEYLLSLENPSTALRDYVLAIEYLEHLPESGNLHVKFKTKYSSSWSRRWRRWFFISGYFFCAFLALSPIFFLASFKIKSRHRAVGCNRVHRGVWHTGIRLNKTIRTALSRGEISIRAKTARSGNPQPININA